MEARIVSVQIGGIGDELGLEPGDAIVEIDGTTPRDLIDYRYALAEECVLVSVRKASGELLEFEIEKDPDEGLGVGFESPLFDGLRECNNRCVFCFVDQMPKGVRRSTLLHDDDYRLSFLGGNFVTLTNLEEEDFARILSLRLSPLYASIHATDPDVRRRLFRSKNADRALPALERLLAGGITVHTQVVVVPGLNDGAALERTVRDLAALHPGVASLGIVPVGLTAHRERLPELPAVGPTEATAILDAIEVWQREFRRRLGTRFCFAADELYLAAERPLPAVREYEDFPQLENGIGLCASFRQEFLRAARNLVPQCVTRIHTGVSAAPFLRGLLAEAGLEGAVEVRAVANRWLGESVTVAGLLAGRDVAGSLAEPGAELHLVPAIALDAEERFLDDIPLGSLAPATGRLLAIGSARELARAIRKGGASR